MKLKLALVVAIVVVIGSAGYLLYVHTPNNPSSQVTPYSVPVVPRTLTDVPDGGDAPDGYRSVGDKQMDIVFNMPSDWTLRPLHEGGDPMLVSPDYAPRPDYFGSATGAYLGYAITDTLETFPTDPDEFLAYMREKTLYKEFSLDGHPAFINDSSAIDGYKDVVSYLGGGKYLLVDFDDEKLKNAPALDEFLRSFHAGE